MAELVVTQKEKELSTYTLDNGTVTIGRGAGNDIRLNSPTVAPRHARISLFDGECSIHNLTVSAGTFVNGLEVERAALFDQDVIHIGPYKISVRGGELGRRAGSDAEKPGAAPAPGTGDDPGDGRSRPGQQNHGDGSQRPFDVLEQINELETALGPYLDRRRAGRAADGEAHTPTPTTPAAATAEAGRGQPDDTPPAQAAVEPAGRAPMEEAVTVEEPAAPRKPFVIDPKPDGAAPPADTAAPGLLCTGIDVISGPAKGNRIYFTQQTAELGVGRDTVLTIRGDDEGYIATAANEGIVVSVNGDAVLDDPVALENGDLIDFANLRARFFVET